MTSGFFTGDFLRGLTFRVLFFLSLALLPLGLIAISQTHQIDRQNRQSGELSLLAITEQAASVEAQVFRQALGAVEARLWVGESRFSAGVQPDAAGCSFEVALEAGPAEVLTTLVREDGQEHGAYWCAVEYLGE